MSTDQHSQINPAQIVLIISVALLAIVGVGWFALDADPGTADKAPQRVPPAETVTESSTETTQPDTTGVAPRTPADEDSDGTSAVIEENTADDASVVASVDAVEAEDVPDPAQAVETNLRKARLAAEAEMLVSPDQQSALHFYSLVLAEDPENPLAEAELDAVLGRLAVSATELLDAEDYDGAYDLARKVATLRPDHVLVNNVQQTVNQVSGDLVATAMSQAEAGDNQAALDTVQAAADLPGSNRDYLRAVRESIDDLLQARQAAAQAAEEQRQDDARSLANWMERVRAAIAAGRLTGNGDDSALSVLAERDDSGEIGRQLRGEWLSALLAAASSRIDAGTLDEAETMVALAETSASDNEAVGRLREALENRYANAEAARVMPVSDMVSISRPAPAYPRRAEERGL
ncbi:MAG: hypothetical protein AAGA61_08590, partial [Pseudomonadota bacterium]